MLKEHIIQEIKKIDNEVCNSNFESYKLPKYDSATHYLELTKSGYFYSIINLRQNLKMLSDYYFVEVCGAKNVDLFMITPSISSPMGLGSNSEAIPIKFGNLDSFLVDSSQFGFEPILLNNIDKVYCYLPSLRGEKPDKRHLNQFFNCEAEINGDINKLIPLIENFIKTLVEGFLLMPNILKKLSLDYESSIKVLKDISEISSLPSITFDQAVNALVDNGYKELVKFEKFGRDITAKGELKLAEIFKFQVPFWIRDYDRNRVPFYQKPNPQKPTQVINGDIIFPPIIEGSFGGEIVGSGQRQDNYQEMMDSLKQQNVDPEPYDWYVNLRRLPNYKTTSGFGLGVERFITWLLCRDDIKDVILYPRILNEVTKP